MFCLLNKAKFLPSEFLLDHSAGDSHCSRRCYGPPSSSSQLHHRLLLLSPCVPCHPCSKIRELAQRGPYTRTSPTSRWQTPHHNTVTIATRKQHVWSIRDYHLPHSGKLCKCPVRFFQYHVAGYHEARHHRDNSGIKLLQQTVSHLHSFVHSLWIPESSRFSRTPPVQVW